MLIIKWWMLLLFFYSSYIHGFVFVADLPRDGPHITGEERQYQIGDWLNLNCTSGKSHPPPMVDWLINEDAVINNLNQMLCFEYYTFASVWVKIEGPEHFHIIISFENPSLPSIYIRYTTPTPTFVLSHLSYPSDCVCYRGAHSACVSIRYIHMHV